MAQKFFARSFENFKGLDLRKSFLSRDPAFAIEFENVELSSSTSLQEIDGFKVAASTIKEPAYNSGGVLMTEVGPRFGLKRYVYQDNSTGETKEELIGVGNGLWKLAKGYFIVDGPANSEIKITHSATASVVTLYASNAVVYTGTFTGEGLTYTASNRLVDMLTAVNATSGFAASLHPRAKVNGAQTGVGYTAALTVDTGHTMAPASGVPLRVPADCKYPGGSDHRLTWLDVLSTTSTTLRVSNFNTTSRIYTGATLTSFDISDDAEVGVGLLPVHHLPYLARTACASALTIEFYYWEQIYHASTTGSLLLHSIHTVDDERQKKWYPQQANLVAINNSNCLFVGSPYSLFTDTYNNGFEAGLVKYDGQQFYIAGLPTPPIPSLALHSATGFDDGVYKYLYQYKAVDARNNLNFSNPSLFNGEVSVVADNGAGMNTVTVTFTPYQLSTGFEGKYGIAGVNGDQTLSTGSTTRTVTISSGHSLRPGGYVYYIDQTSGEMMRRKALTVTATTVVLEFMSIDPTETVSNTQGMGLGHTVEIYRTKANGQTYYLLTEVPAIQNVATDTFVDDISDDDLGIEWDGPKIGADRRDMPPPGPLVENHQGKIVIGGYYKTPNSIAWSGLESSEYFSASTNATDIAAPEAGPLTAMASAGADALLCFKDRSLIPMGGDFYSGSVFPIELHEGDVGCPSPNGWARLRTSIVWMSAIGPRSYKDGEVQNFDDKFRPLFTTIGTQVRGSSWDSNGLVVRRTVAFNDPFNQRILFFLPDELTSTLALNEWAPTASSIFLCWDYFNDCWSRWTDNLTSSPVLNAAGGMEYYNNELFMLGRVKSSFCDWLSSYLYVQRSTGTVYGNSSFVPQWEFLSEPSFPKEYTNLKVWKIEDSDNDMPSPTVNIFSDFSLATSDSFVLTFNDGDLATTYPLPMRNRSALTFRISTLKTPLRLTGWELEIAANFRKERLDFNP